MDDDAAAELAAAETEVVRVHAEAAVALMAGIAHRPRATLPAVVGFHGQTVAHAPDEGWTWQLGDGAALARVLNRPVVWDFRTQDMRTRRRGGAARALLPLRAGQADRRNK